jgi:hypothetical protein
MGDVAEEVERFRQDRFASEERSWQSLELLFRPFVVAFTFYQECDQRAGIDDR